MKTSNKILIAFAAALILIPVLGMVIVSATQYKTGSYKDEVHKIENFSTPTKKMVSIALTSAFQSVNVADGKNLSLNIHLIKDDKFGVKIQDQFKDLISASVDANGQLQLTIKDQKSTGEDRVRHYTHIYIYAPNVNALTVANTSDLVIASMADSLTLDVKKTGSLSFDSETRIKQLNLNASELERLSFREDDIKSIDLNLTNTKLYIDGNSFDNASITTHVNCEVEIGREYSEDQKQTINNLILNTNGIADVKIENTIINKCSGQFSDETKVQMPAVNINQMYKK